MMHTLNVLMEAIAVGIITVVLGSVVGYAVGKLLPSKVVASGICKGGNDKRQMEITLFLTGFIFHVIFEYGGMNKWYCINGAACKI